MIIIVLLVVAAWAVAIAFVVGRVTADRQINTNHRKLAMIALTLQNKDNLLPFLSVSERKQLDDTIDGYTKLETVRTIER